MAISRTDKRPSAVEETVHELWWLTLLQGILAVFFGIAAIFWPGLTLVALVYLFSAFVLAWGIIEIVRGFLGIGKRGAWWLTLLFGVAGLGVGIYLVRHPKVTFGTFIVVIGLLLIARGIIDIVGVFVDRQNAHNKVLWAIVGVAALLAGILVLVQPVAGGVAFVWILGLYALVYGALTISLSIQARELLSEMRDDNKGS